MPKIGMPYSNPRLEIRTSDVRTRAWYIAPIYTADGDSHITHRDSSSGCVHPRSGGPNVRSGRADLRSGGPNVRSDVRTLAVDVRTLAVDVRTLAVEVRTLAVEVRTFVVLYGDTRDLQGHRSY